MCLVFLYLPVLLTLASRTCAENEGFIISCAENQKAFRGSCFEFVDLRQSFLRAQAWCEESGGHLAFIADETTQSFLQGHLNPREDWWFGLVRTKQQSLTDNGPLTWLDGSPVSYSKWKRSPQPGAACGYITRNSDFQWEVTDDCSEERPFICEFESGRSIVCGDYDAVLQCGSGQLITIDQSLYGRSNPHYCRSTVTAAMLSQHQCGWVDVAESVAAHCNGRQQCRTSELMSSLVEQCPDLRSYLSVDYHCEDGLTLSVNTVAAVLRDVHIGVRFLARGSEGNLRCALSTGDGHVIYLPRQEGFQYRVVHKYTRPNTFTVAVECVAGRTHNTAWRVITIQEPIAEIGVIKCFAGNRSFHESGCKALYGAALHIQVEVKAGTNVTYKVQRKEMLLSGLSVVKGNIPQNITVSGEMVNEMGPGCHHLTLHASNLVTFPEATARLRVCILKLRAWNDFSSVEQHVDIFGSRYKNSAVQRVKQIRAVRSPQKITAAPSSSVTGKNKVITLSFAGSVNLDDSNFRYEWKCLNPCTCQGPSSGSTKVISGDCLPDPFHFYKYYFNRIRRSNNNKHIIDSICITVTPNHYTADRVSLNCVSGCNPTMNGKDAKFKMVCQSTCKTVIWNIEDPDDKDWPDETKSCYKTAKRRPLIERQDGGNEYTVKASVIALAKENNRDIKVVISARDRALYASYTIKTSSADATTPSPTTVATATANKATATLVSQATSTVSIATTAGATAHTARGKSSATTTTKIVRLSCHIVPHSGTVLDTFNMWCQTAPPCSNCQYCFKNADKHLRCSSTNEVKSIFLPVGDETNGYKLEITATATSGKTVANATFTVMVSFPTLEMSSPASLNETLRNAVALLSHQGLLSGENLGQIFFAVASQMNNHLTTPMYTPLKLNVRDYMVALMIDVVEENIPTTPEEVQVIARGLSAVVLRGTELSFTAQIAASIFLKNLSSTVLTMDISSSEENMVQIYLASVEIVEGVMYILEYSSSKLISDPLFDSLNNVLSGLLLHKSINDPPTTIQKEHVSVLAERVSPEKVNKKHLKISRCSCAAFSLPVFPPSILSSKKSVDLRMISLRRNLFSWHDQLNISGTIGSLSLTEENGTGIPVENLSEDIEIFLPRDGGCGQLKSSILDLGHFSTTVINVSSANVSLVVKMIPSEDPLPFKVFLGYLEYPTTTNYIAMADMPQEGATIEERYTWQLDTEALKGNLGIHYLVVRPIVGPGVKSINGTVTITPITASCTFWNDSSETWNYKGCRVGWKTTHAVTHCLCNHLTFFGSSFFVTPNLVDPSRSAELFGSFAENPVVVCFVGALFVAYVLAVVWARRKDVQDIAKVKVSVLEDNDPMDQYQYLLSIGTGHRMGASTSSQVVITLLGADGNSEPHHLSDPDKTVFERGAVDLFLLTTPIQLGDLQAVQLWHNNSGDHPAWYVSTVTVQDLQTKQRWHFLCNSWLSVDVDDCSLNKVFPAASDDDLKNFSNLFFMRTTKDFNDGHLWFSVINRPPGSNFTCVQRVSCCFSLLLCTMLTSIMFYGIPTDPAEQTLDLGHFEFTWQQFMVGVQSALIMFPVNILIVSVFRNTRPRETSCCQRKKQKNDVLEEDINSRATPAETNARIGLDAIIEDITKVSNWLSKTVKSNIPGTESKFGPGQQNDINAILSAVEEVIRQNNKSTHNTWSEAWPQVSGADKGPEKKNSKTQDLYKQLCHMEEQLSQLGPSSFASPQSHSQAQQQVRRVKELLEDQRFRSNCINLDENSCKKSTVADGSNENESKTKRRCCQRGLPWWFIFVGWLLVIATSVISGYFTMLYGLNFGKPQSISWLVSMIVSFFQSLLFIQPIKVLCLAVFFALVLKNVDDGDFQNVAVSRKQGNASDCQDLPPRKRDGGIYEPPHPSDVEKMRRNRILEQKAFALLTEILTYMGFLWMLLLVAYGQRDPNAFYLNQHIRKSFTQSVSDSMSLGDVFTWTRTSLLSNLFGVYPGFITDGNSKLVGNARLRQLRVQSCSCQITSYMREFVPDCHSPYSWDREDMGSYLPGWNPSLTHNICTRKSDPWTYQTQEELRSSPIWGQLNLYRGGGYVAELGPDVETANRTLEHLFRKTWLDMYTRAIFVEFTVYNANVNLFCIVTLLLETAAVGAFQFHTELQTVRLYRSTGNLHVFVLAAEIIYMLFILYYMFLQGKLMKQQRCAYFKNKWNLLDLSIILLSWSAVAVFIKRTLLGNRDISYYHDHRDQFASFYETATADTVLQYLIAFLVMLATIKMWHLLRLHPKMNMISATLQRAWSDISGFLLIITIMLMAYSSTSYLVYGWKLSTYKTLANAILTIFSLQIGKFNYEEVLSNTSLMGGLLFGSCIVFMTFVVVNLLISVILVAFNEEQTHHKPSEEEEVVDVMLRKVFNVFGIRYKCAADTAGLSVNDGKGTNTLNSTPKDGNVFHLHPEQN